MDRQNDEIETLQTLLDQACAKAEDILRRTASLLSEFLSLRSVFQQCHDSHQRHSTVNGLPGLKGLVTSVTTEHAAVKRLLEELRAQLSAQDRSTLSTQDKDDFRRVETLKQTCERLDCSNIYSEEAAWDVVKRCSGLEQLASKFSLHTTIGPCSLCKGKKCPPKGKQDSKSVVHVDAVVNGGAEWLRIIGLGERRLLHEMAEMGWDWGASDESSGDDDDDDCEVSVAVILRQLVAAARANRHNYRPPSLHIVFTRVAEGSDSEIDRLIRKLRSIPKHGVEIRVDCSNSEFLTSPSPPLETALRNLVTEDLSDITSTVNLDCSILVALASDVTHSAIEKQTWHRWDVASQIDEEKKVGSTLVKALYPVLRSRRLVCTAKAAERFWTIVDTLATATEAARAELILPKAGNTEKTSEELLAELQTLSINPVDPNLRLPIEVVTPVDLTTEGRDLATDNEPRRLPRSAELISTVASDLNRDIILYGWLHQITTVTANNSLAKQIRLLVEEQRTDDDQAGPSIRVFPFTRALATKGRPARSELS
ncbi:hypothetical protein CONLIGDRAFT_156663 [Coniochaeta ligniaria NRRL 30616]|uniref:DUF1308 domain-containing protein n=1 Tax=Coniochaeta ligniaria NRRL 30616 TaxID=1408157 RepID=A0A1J7IZM6_9PEZI|nr:hypothetical protein CONLIGDRAFT_156663 [Coniochaeta ligniaria NRRL 30616]